MEDIRAKTTEDVAVLKAEKEFEKSGKYIVACRVQDNLGGEAVNWAKGGGKLPPLLSSRPTGGLRK